MFHKNYVIKKDSARKISNFLSKNSQLNQSEFNLEVKWRVTCEKLTLQSKFVSLREETKKLKKNKEKSEFFFSSDKVDKLLSLYFTTCFRRLIEEKELNQKCFSALWALRMMLAAVIALMAFLISVNWILYKRTISSRATIDFALIA